MWYTLCENQFRKVARILTNSIITKEQKIIACWLYLMAILVGLMIIIGGITRLTGSGLSMVEWRPLIGTIPPLNNDEWMRVFDLYKKALNMPS